MVKRKTFAISSYNQFETFINKKNNKKIIILYFKNYLIKGLGVEWLHTFINLIKKNYKEYNIKFYVDCGNDFGLSLQIIKENVDYLKLRSNRIILNKISQIAKKNKVVLNPNFDVVDAK